MELSKFRLYRFIITARINKKAVFLNNYLSLFVVNRKGKNKIQMKKKPDSLKNEKEMKLNLTLNDKPK